MKKLIVAILVMLVTSASMMAIGVTINTKSQWDGTECAEATKGLCIHLELSVTAPSFNSFNGNINYDKSRGVVITFSKSKDMTQTVFSSYFGGGVFLVDADSPISLDILRKINYPYVSKGLILKQGKYQYSINGDEITVIIPVDYSGTK